MTDVFVTLLVFAFFVLLIGLLIWTLVDLARNSDLGSRTKVICVAASFGPLVGQALAACLLPRKDESPAFAGLSVSRGAEIRTRDL